MKEVEDVGHRGRRPLTWLPEPACLRLAWKPGRASRVVLLVSTGVLLLFAGAVFKATFDGAVARHEVGWDLGLYTRIARLWLTTGHAYWPAQLTGPYPGAGDVNLYPPVALYWFLPFTVLPAILWWMIPLGVISAAFWRLRPAIWTWPIFAGIACTVPFASMLTNGNSSMWAVAAVALATRWPAAAVTLALKPSMFPMTFVFASSRGWWLGCIGLAVAAIPLGGLWLDWLTAIRNYSGETLLYSVNALPLLAAPILAWLARTRDWRRPLPAAPPGTS